jgi:NAD(P)-dependent dehydrogenase (short-subunit alcohol dehydrogenase family)
MSDRPLSVIVTGGGGGIGSDICQVFSDGCARVAIWELDIDAGERVAAKLPGAAAFSVDITDSAAVNDAVEQTVAEFGGVDVLINNAGVSLVGDHTHELSDDIWNRSIAVMQTGVFFCSSAVGQKMIEQSKGSIVNISSIRGFSPNPGRLPYCAAKAAVIIMTQVMAAEWGPLGIRVNAVAPGVQATGMWDEEVARGLYDEQEYVDTIPARRIGDPREVGRLCAFLASDAAAYITGACVTIDGGLTTIPSG